MPFFMPNHNTKQAVALAILSFCTISISRWISREQGHLLLTTYFIGFAAYALLMFDFGRNLPKASKRTIWAMLAVGIALRCSFLGVTPSLSDDFWRFLWDGQLLAHNVNPFRYTPSDYLATTPEGYPLPLQKLFGKLNSPDYYSVYPPVNQGVFALGAILFPTSMKGQLVWIQFFLLLCEIGTISLLYRNNSKYSALLYALNPLVVLEIVGNCHFEGAMICFLIAGFFTWKRRNIFSTALWWTLAVCSKLLPLMFVPILLADMTKRKAFLLLGILGSGTLFLFSPLLDGYFLENISKSLNLYFRQFEFNASLYYLLKGIEYAIKGYNESRLFGTALSLFVVLGVLVLTFKVYQRALALERALLLAALIHLFCATVVHPWYMTLPFALACVVLPAVSIHPVVEINIKYLSKPILLALIWSGLVFISYTHYNNGNFQEQYGLIALEYSVLLCFTLLWSYTE